MGKTEIWKVHPIRNEIILTLIRHKGEILSTDLLRIIQNQYIDVNRSVLDKIFFKLEVEMIIDVQRIRKNVNKITLKKDAPIAFEILKKNFK